MSERNLEYSLNEMQARADELFAVQGLAKVVYNGTYAIRHALQVARLLPPIEIAGETPDEDQEIPASAVLYSVQRTLMINQRRHYFVRRMDDPKTEMCWTPGIDDTPRSSNTGAEIRGETLHDLSTGLMQGQPFDPELHMIGEAADGTPYIADKTRRTQLP